MRYTENLLCIIRTVVIFLCLNQCQPNVFGQSSDHEICIAGTLKYSFISKINAQSYQISIALPFNYSTTDTFHYPVMYILDSDPNLPLAALIQRNMSYSHEVPEMIMVGIGYQVENFLASRPYRMLVYSPTQVPKLDSELTASHHMKMKSGGASDFLEVMGKEVIPYIEKSYKTSNDRCLAGHSFGGLFAVYALFHKPSLFDKYLISSPSLDWDNFETSREESQFYSGSSNVLQATVFISVGSLEPDPMIPDMKEFVKTLRSRNYAGFSLNEYIFTDETHLSVIPYAISRGIRNLYNSGNSK